MPDEYISREAALKAANEWVSEACMAPVMRVSRLLDKLQKVPAADVAPVVHGKWLEEDGAQICSNCGEEHCWDEYRATFCDNCGARMDGAAK